MLVDTHAHLYWESFQEDFEEVIQRAIEAGITHLINIGVDVEKSKIAVKQAQEIVRENLQVFASLGIHPEEAIKYSNPDVSIHKDIEQLEKLYKQSLPLPSGKRQSQPDQPFDSAQGRIVAIGECGLDFLFANTPWSPSHSDPKPDLTSNQIKDLQKKLFQAQINLAKKLNLPLLIHCRDDRSQDPKNTECWDQTIDMTRDHFGIYHCYSGLSQTTQRILKETKFLISFAGNLTYPNNQYLKEAVKDIPLDRIVVETDCPFLPPQAKRGKRNEPSFIIETVAMIAQIKNLTESEVNKQTTKNLTQIGLTAV